MDRKREDGNCRTSRRLILTGEGIDDMHGVCMHVKICEDMQEKKVGQVLGM